MIYRFEWAVETEVEIIRKWCLKICPLTFPEVEISLRTILRLGRLCQQNGTLCQDIVELLPMLCCLNPNKRVSSDFKSGREGKTQNSIKTYSSA